MKVGDVGEILFDGQYIFFLVVKERYGIPPLTSVFEKVLLNLLNKMNNNKLTKIAFLKSGFDQIPPQDAFELVSKIFAKSNIEVSICLTSYVSKLL